MKSLQIALAMAAVEFNLFLAHFVEAVASGCHEGTAALVASNRVLIDFIKRTALGALAVLTLSAAAHAQAGPALIPLTSTSKLYGVSFDATPAPDAFAAYCPKCAGQTLIGPGHSIFDLTRAGVPVAHLAFSWAYSPNTSGTLASGGAVLFRGGVNIGSAAEVALGQLPAASEAVGASTPWLQVAAQAVTIDGFYGLRAGGANGLPKNPWGVGLTVSCSPSALKAAFGF
jgi:hypothetical protein